MEDKLALYEEVMDKGDSGEQRHLALTDLFFLMVVVCRRVDMKHPWVYDRCNEVQANPDGYLDIWAREHFKSSLITFGKTIQDILKNPELTVGIFSHTRGIAKGFLAQIKREFEGNEFMKELFPDILYKCPEKESPKWSLDDGIIVKRQSNPKESTIEAWGLVDSQPTSRHYSLMVYDDVVTLESVSTPEQIKKTNDAWAMSKYLGGQNLRVRYIGTRYHAQDAYAKMMELKEAIPRIYPATDDGTFTGKPVLFTQEAFESKILDRFAAASHLLCDPLADDALGFSEAWLQYYNELRNHLKWNYYILVDPANDKKKKSDYTVIVVIGLAPDNNYYLVDAIRDRLNLQERTKKVFEMVRKWNPKNVGYERYGMQSDIEHIRYVMEHEGYRFRITELGGQMGKVERIRRLVPIFAESRFFLPRRLLFVDYTGKTRDFVAEFINDEYKTFPVSTHDDMCDGISRICDEDLCATFPKGIVNKDGEFVQNKKYDPLAIRDNQYQPI